MDDKKPDEVASVLEEMHAAGKGIVGMKILGEGRIKTPERKDASLRYVLGLGTVDAFIIGFEFDRADRRHPQADDRRRWRRSRDDRTASRRVRSGTDRADPMRSDRAADAWISHSPR